MATGLVEITVPPADSYCLKTPDYPRLPEKPTQNRLSGNTTSMIGLQSLFVIAEPGFYQQHADLVRIQTYRTTHYRLATFSAGCDVDFRPLSGLLSSTIFNPHGAEPGGLAETVLPRRRQHE